MVDNAAFYNKYVQVLKNRFDNLINENIQLETQIILAKEEIEKYVAEISSLNSEIEKLKKKTTTRSRTQDNKDE